MGDVNTLSRPSVVADDAPSSRVDDLFGSSRTRSAVFIARALLKRSSGLFAMARATNAPKAGGNAWFALNGGTG
jgi:hypothetical protein